MRRRLWVILLALVSAACAGQPELRAIDPVAPLTVQGTTQPVAVGDISLAGGIEASTIGNFHGGAANIPYSRHSGKILQGMDRRFRLMAFDELQSAGYTMAGQKEMLISDTKATTPPDAAFSLGGLISEVRYDTYSSVFKQSTESFATITWTLTNVQSGRQVYSTVTAGEVEGPHEDIGTILEAVRVSLRKALADRSFVSTIK